jgi:hypothetical protein
MINPSLPKASVRLRFNPSAESLAGTKTVSGSLMFKSAALDMVPSRHDSAYELDLPAGRVTPDGATQPLGRKF